MSWKIDPKTGDYTMVNGKPVEDESLVYPAFYRIKGHRGEWLHAPDSQWGSDLFMMQRAKISAQSIQQIKSMMLQALQPLLDDGRALDVVVDLPGTQNIARNETEAGVTITDASGQIQQLGLQPVGD